VIILGKIAPVSAKYIISASIKTEGVVEKPDVIGAVFGQTEGLLGEDLELRELQKGGKIGRIDVHLDISGGKATGTITVPSSLDKAKTAIVAAAVETIKRIGPCDATIEVTGIEDVRTVKRDYVMDRAKQLLQKMDKTDSQEFAQNVKDSVRTMDIIHFGPDNLPAGKDITTSKEVIVVEGRADVINLLKNGIKNVISMDGTSVPKTIVDLSKERELTLFIDGDRGGRLIEKSLMQVADVKFVAIAPRGKEVEELTMKEVHQCLRSRKPARGTRRPARRTPTRTRTRSRSKLDPELSKQFKKMLEELVGTHGIYLLDDKMKVLGKIPSKELESTLSNISEVFAIVFDGSISKELITVAEKTGVSFLVAANGKGSSRRVKVLSGSDL
jgi:DNA primase